MHLAGHVALDEPYFLLEEDGYEFEFPPSPDDYRAQLRCSLRVLRSAAPRVVFDRTPLDFLAYLAALGASIEGEADPSVVRSALARLDLRVVVPITAAAERLLPQPGLLRLRETMNGVLLDLLSADRAGGVAADVPRDRAERPGLDGQLGLQSRPARAAGRREYGGDDTGCG